MSRASRLKATQKRRRRKNPAQYTQRSASAFAEEVRETVMLGGRPVTVVHSGNLKLPADW